MKVGQGSEVACQNGMTRRQLLRAGVVVGLGAGLAGSGLVAAGCGDSGEPAAEATTVDAEGLKAGGVMTFATDRMFPSDTLETLTHMNQAIDTLQGTIREGLVATEGDFTVHPRLAERWEVNEDNTEYTFHMRPNVVWHDGSPLTARDAAYTLERILAPESGSGVRDRLGESIDKVVVVDDMTLKLELKRADGLILQPLATYACYFVKEGSDVNDGIGTGPFKLKSFDPGTSFEVEKFNEYWMDGAPILDGVRGINVPEASTMLQAVATGDADVCQIAFEQLAVADANEQLKVDPFERAQFHNCIAMVTAEPWSDPRVREALKRSLDREMVMKIAFVDSGFMAPDACIASGDTDMTSGLEERTTMDRALAAQLMAEAGYENGVDVELKYPGDAVYASYTLAVAAALRGSPFRVTPVAVPSDTYWDTVWLKDAFHVSNWNRRHPIETMSLQVKSDAPWNESKWQSPKMDELLAAALAAGPDDLSAATSEACQWMSDGDDSGGGMGGSGILIPAFSNRLFLSRVDTTIVPVFNSSIDFRRCGFVA